MINEEAHMSYDRDEAMRVYQEAENAAYKPWSAAKVVMYCSY